MRKTLVTLSLSLMLGASALAAISVATAQPAAPRAQLAQANGPQQGRPGPGNRFNRQPPSPEQMAARRADMCQNMNARAAGRLAELEVRLNLTANQRAAFNKWRDTRLAAAKRRADGCATAPAPQGRGPANAQNAQATPPSPVERMARQEQMLRQRLADLTAERPALEALYNSLTPEQRQKFTPLGGGRNGMGRGNQRGRIGMMMQGRPGGNMGGGMGGDGPRGMMGGGMGGGMRGPGGPMGPGMAPPPAQ